MNLRAHNESQHNALQALFEREAWFLSERAGYDVTTTTEGRQALEMRIAYLITESQGAWIHDLPTTIND